MGTLRERRVVFPSPFPPAPRLTMSEWLWERRINASPQQQTQRTGQGNYQEPALDGTFAARTPELHKLRRLSGKLGVHAKAGGCEAERLTFTCGGRGGMSCFNRA